MNPLISIIMVNRNRGAYLEEAISSVLAQTLSAWELVIVDDASDDSSREVIARFASDPRLRVIFHENNQGIGASRREAVAAASAPLIGILDSDDALEKNALEIMVQAHQDYESGLIYSQYQVCNAALQPLRLGTNRAIPLDSNNLAENCISHFVTFKKTAYQKCAGYDPRLNLAEDKDLFYKLEEVCGSYFIDQVLYRYRLHKTAISSASWLKRMRAHFYHFLVRERAYRRRGQSRSRRLINTLKYWLDRWYFPLIVPRGLAKFQTLSQQACCPLDYWRLASDFYAGPPLRGLNLNIRPAQLEKEILALMERVQELKPRFILEIGTATGGTLFLWSKLAAPDATIISLDLPNGRFGGGYLSSRQKLMETFPSPTQTLHLLQANSHDPRTKQEIHRLLAGQQLDFLFIDGDHSYSGVKADWENFSPLVRPGGLVALHDIALNNNDPASEVHRLWEELKQQHVATEIIAAPDQGWAGIGLIKL